MDQKNRDSLILTLQQARRVIKIVIGFTVLLIGLLMLALPGPAVVVIPIGLGILATEFVWAKNMLKRFKDGANNLKNTILKNSKKGNA
jgi:tellurite resistance protein TerC